MGIFKKKIEFFYITRYTKMKTSILGPPIQQIIYCNDEGNACLKFYFTGDENVDSYINRQWQRFTSFFF
jgi:hypothetical protein